MTITTPPFVLTVRKLSKSYGATPVLNGVDFTVARGEVHALLGGNGAGKSTMIRIITGAASKNGGEIHFFDGEGKEQSEAEGRAKVAVVHQELALLPHLSVAENIALPHQKQGARRYSRSAAAQTAWQALCLIDQDFARTALHRLVGSLSLHEGQMVEIARALSSGAELILLDEPTANLTAAETERLFVMLRRLTRDNGLSVVFVSHRMREIHRIANVCTIIRDGRTVVDRQPLDTLSNADIVENMGQAGTVELVQPIAAPVAVSGDGACITLEDSSVRLELCPGTILGVAGAPAGPAGLIEALTGAARAKRWTVARAGWPNHLGSPRRAVRLGAGFITGDRTHKGVLHSLPLIDNVMASRRVVRKNALTGGGEDQECLELLRTLKVKASSIRDLPNTLSGGTQQKLLLARWLGLAARLLVLEEPTRGVDIGTKRDIYQIIRQMAVSGAVIVWWSTENAELLEVCDRIMAFDTEGRCAGVLERDRFGEDTLATLTGMVA